MFGDIMVAAASISDLELADQNAVHDPSLAPYVDRVLEALGHPDALATDESIVRHFLESGEEPHRSGGVEVARGSNIRETR